MREEEEEERGGGGGDEGGRGGEEMDNNSSPIIQIIYVNITQDTTLRDGILNIFTKGYRWKKDFTRTSKQHNVSTWCAATIKDEVYFQLHIILYLFVLGFFFFFCINAFGHIL